MHFYYLREAVLKGTADAPETSLLRLLNEGLQESTSTGDSFKQLNLALTSFQWMYLDPFESHKGFLYIAYMQ